VADGGRQEANLEIWFTQLGDICACKSDIFSLYYKVILVIMPNK